MYLIVGCPLWRNKVHIVRFAVYVVYSALDNSNGHSGHSLRHRWPQLLLLRCYATPVVWQDDIQHVEDDETDMPHRIHDDAVRPRIFQPRFYRPQRYQPRPLATRYWPSVVQRTTASAAICRPGMILFYALFLQLFPRFSLSLKWLLKVYATRLIDILAESHC